ncbi:MAG: ATP-binding cassette domain-containing protein [Betaproteobacteria bacterium]|nr:ATP-binding cassette domain-containing protein [Betaproteobacteria bacterium]
MTLLTLQSAQLAFGMQPLLDGAGLSILDGERIGLIGRNGTGKSSLINVLTGRMALDDGERHVREGLRMALVEQEPELPAADDLRASLARRGDLASIRDERERWQVEARLDEYLHRMGLDNAAMLSPAKASGGERKRGALALALALMPDLLLLDEPTNHLDVEGIEQLEVLLQRGPACVVVTHDRRFLDRVVTRIVELDRGVLRSYPGDFSSYEKTRADELAAEALANRRFDKFWKEEEAWIRKGVEARRTRSAGRVARLEQLRNDRAARRDRLGNVKLNLDAGERSGKLVAELDGVTKSFGDQVVVRDFSTRIQRGDRIGLIGPNGAGKSTLIKLILGALPPDSGSIKLGTRLQPAYFDQMRAQLDPEATVADTISPGSDWVEVNGQKKHVMSYLGDFLFPPRRAESPIRMLSGGERNRLLLARLFAQPANLLVLDEPTNDLDIESLELLEQTLQDYTGTLLLVSHDRTFMDNIVTQSFVAEGLGAWREYPGGYADWVAQRPRDWAFRKESGADAAQLAAKPAAESGRAAKVKLSFKETRDLAELPKEIEALEAEQRALHEGMAAPDYYKAPLETRQRDEARNGEIESLLLEKLERWTALEEKAKVAGL